MNRALLLAVWALIGAKVHAGEPIEPLDADFLEYLANMEGDGDNWTLLDGADPKQPRTDEDGATDTRSRRQPSNGAALEAPLTRASVNEPAIKAPPAGASTNDAAIKAPSARKPTEEAATPAVEKP